LRCSEDLDGRTIGGLNTPFILIVELHIQYGFFRPSTIQTGGVGTRSGEVPEHASIKGGSLGRGLLGFTDGGSSLEE